MSVTVKICGITNVDDARMVAEAGADAVGFMFVEESPRFIDLEVGAEIARALPPFVARVGVFVNPDAQKVMQAIIRCQLTMLQFHGEEPPGFCLQFGLMSIKAFRVRDRESLSRLTEYPTDAWLLDSFVPGKAGGTGATFNWDLAVEAKGLGRPIFLAGGLTPENVAEAVRQVQPFAVDVSSGVELRPGTKDPVKVRTFIAAAKEALR